MGVHIMRQMALSTATLALLFLSGVLPPGTATAATYYTATTGSDSNPGTQARPFGTIARGIGALTAGDTLLIRGGHYEEVIHNDYYTIPSGTSVDNPVTIAAYPGETVTLRRVVITSAQYVIFKDLIIDATGQPEGIAIASGSYEAAGDNYIRFQNVEVKNWQGYDSAGVFVYSNYNEFINCKVHDSAAQDRPHGFYILGSNNLVDGCSIYNNAGYGLHLFNGYTNTGVHNNILRNNRVYNNRGSSNPGGITINHGDNNIVHGNIVHGNGGEAIGVSTANDTQIFDNTFSDNDAGMKIGSNCHGTVVTNNTFILDDISDAGVGTILSGNICDTAGFGCSVIFNRLHVEGIIAQTVNANQ